jgi:hypothetical protein
MDDARDLGNDDRCLVTLHNNGRGQRDDDAREMKLEMLNGNTWRLHLHYALF